MYNKNQINFSTLYGLGFKTKFPGTIASILTLIFSYIILLYIDLILYFLLLILILIFGYISTKNYLNEVKKHDPSEVVVDEVIGQFISLLFIPITFKESGLNSIFVVFCFIFSFLLFRFFDILKPWPISYFDKKKGVFWIFFDDILAGIFSFFICYFFLEAYLI